MGGSQLKVVLHSDQRLDPTKPQKFDIKLSITKEKSTPSLKTGVMVHDRPTPKTKMAPKTKMPPKRPKLMPPTKIIKTQLKSSRAPSAPVPVMAHDQYTL